jgi:hypothetical protein
MLRRILHLPPADPELAALMRPANWFFGILALVLIVIIVAWVGQLR